MSKATTGTALRLGFIGLGIMGAPMAGHLRAAGHALQVHTRSKVPQALHDAGAVSCANGAAVARDADIIFLMLPDTPDVEKVLFGDDGVAAGLATGGADKIVVDCSSIDPLATRDFAARISALGAAYLDAPVSGGELGAKAATLTIMVGGEAATFARVRPLFELMGKNITLVGDCGAGQICKVANQMIVANNIASVAEALLLASKAGVDPAQVRLALMGGFAASRVLEVHGEKMLKRNFAPGFRITLHQKDLQIAMNSAKKLGLSLPQTASVAQLMQSAAAHGEGDSDHSGLVRVLERLANHGLA